MPVPPGCPAPPADAAVLVAARRTPFADAGRELAGCSGTDQAAAALAALAGQVRTLGVGAAVADVVLGVCTGPRGNPARVAALAAGLGPQVPGVSVDRQCGSGLDAVRLGAALVREGAELVLAGGFESGSAARAATGRVERAVFAPPPFPDPDMGPAADDLAAHLGIDRRRQDAYAAASHARALAAAAAGAFDAELVEVAGLRADTRPRPGLHEQRLARFRPAFSAGGTVTAGNSCGVSDGAAAVALVPERIRAAAGLPGLVVRAAVACGGDPALPGAAAAPAALLALRRADVDLPDVGAVEVVEAFAAQVLAFTDALGLDPLGADAGRVCAQGGAIALGHPWGASGAALLVRLFARMVRLDGPRLGLAACAVGGGQGVALVVERVG
ncbi:acetyl-CoA C-acetyltransferase [Kineococcus xinjiangensis]|uniref:Probable acetyl-CoA acetyltransferase n=1 Tax=Kineococcus xinjiangensis TaxID=512762 RepID=A0A2S6IPK2_9ACTN|nr:acetyl-CoA C-acyltransferase [Kineococcus xinjiangensis]PPK96159.1 acetyl-CoA C-acetyltransferase [Kineococcus xinjiangensis]